MGLTSPEGKPVEVRPIERGELDRVVLRCWPEREVLDRLFEEQGTIGMAAWEGEKCVGQLHCYRIILPEGTGWESKWGANWWSGEVDDPTDYVFTDRLRWGPGKTDLELRGAVWCHACSHVGRTLEAATQSDDPDPRYFGRGIGTALCRASVAWAREHGYVAVLARGVPEGLREFAVWAGALPWTTYARLGFREVDPVGEGDELPLWAQGDCPPEVMEEVRAALAAGRPAREFHERLMVLELGQRH
jgi:GNAT superfamily N-acetyltransferase